MTKWLTNLLSGTKCIYDFCRKSSKGYSRWEAVYYALMFAWRYMKGAI